MANTNHTLICQECNKPFLHKLPHVTGCSEQCRLQIKRRKSREYMRERMANPDLTEKMDAQRAKSKANSRAKRKQLRIEAKAAGLVLDKYSNQLRKPKPKRPVRIRHEFREGRQRHLESGRLGKNDAWKDWLSIAPEEFLTELYKSKPWLDHRLSYSERTRIRRLHDPAFAMYDRIRAASRRQGKDGYAAVSMRDAIKRNGSSNKIERLVGYSIDKLKDHLESKFTNGMSWESFCNGDIHIDHIIPKSVFDCEIDEELIDCWSLNNLQPLWASDNMIKKDKAVAELSDPVLWMKYGHRVKTIESAREAAWVT